MKECFLTLSVLWFSNSSMSGNLRIYLIIKLTSIGKYLKYLPLNCNKPRLYNSLIQ